MTTNVKHSYRVNTVLIKTLMIAKGLRMVGLARQIGSSLGYTSDLINGRKANFKRQVEIASVLGAEVRNLFPEQARPYIKKVSKEG